MREEPMGHTLLLCHKSGRRRVRGERQEERKTQV